MVWPDGWPVIVGGTKQVNLQPMICGSTKRSVKKNSNDFRRMDDLQLSLLASNVETIAIKVTFVG
jgi:hypothetical protein